MINIKNRYQELDEAGKIKLLDRIRSSGEEFGIYPLSPEQRRMWFLYKTSQNKSEYNVTFSIDIDGKFNRNILEKALLQLFSRQKVFKSRILELSGEAFQIVDNDAVPDLNETEASDEKSIHKLYLEEYQKVFDLEADLPVRTVLIETADGRYILLITVHHIFFDGWSANILKNELLECYEAVMSGKELPGATHQYYEYALESQRSSEKFEANRKYWEELLRKENIYTQIPADLHKKTEMSAESVYHHLALTDKSAADEFCRSRHISPYSLYIAAYVLTLSVFSGEKSIAVGTPVLNRDDARWRNIIGFYSNTIPIFADIDTEIEKDKFLAQIHERVIGGLDHGSYQLDEMASDLKLKRETGYNPIFQSTFALRSDMLTGRKNDENSVVTMKTQRAEHESVMQFDLMGYVNDSENGYGIDFSARASRFTQKRLDSVSEVCGMILSNLLSDKTVKISDCIEGINVSRISEPSSDIVDIISSDGHITEPEVIVFGDYIFIFYTSSSEADTEKLDAALRSVTLSKPFWIRLGEYPLTNGVTDRERLAELALDILSEAKETINNVRMSSDVISYDLTAERSNAGKKYCHITSVTSSAENEEKNCEVTELSFLDGGKLPETEWRLVTDILRTAVEKRPDTELISIRNGGAEKNTTYKGLWKQAETVAANLQAMGYKKGDRMILEISEMLDVIVLFWGIAMAGMTALPLLPPQDYNFLEKSSARTRLENVWKIAHCPDVVGGDAEYDSLSKLNCGMNVLSAEDIFSEKGNTFTPVDIDEYDPVMMMFTSGSTGLPKGVEIHHHRIICRTLGYIEHYPDVTDNEVLMNWMPLEHVGGLVMSHIEGVATAAMQIETESVEILKDPLLWLRLIDKYRVTSTWAPNFAYGMLLDHKDTIKDMDIDLSSVRHILNGGEAINYNSCDELLRLLAEKGLDRACMNPCWGMTETTSGILSSERFGEIKYNNSVAVGTLFAGNYVRIADPDNVPVNMGDIGRLQVKGEAVFTGYYELDEENARSFTEDGWFDTGDLAMIKEGEVIITGRNKEIIIVNGVNVSCLEVEKNIEEIDLVQTGTVGVSAVKDEETNQDQVVIFYGESDKSHRKNIQDQITRIMISSYGFSFNYLVPIPVDEIPRSAIGKIEKKLLVKKFMNGELKAQATGGEDRIPMWFCGTVTEKEELSGAGISETERIIRFESSSENNGHFDKLEYLSRYVAEKAEGSFVVAVSADDPSASLIKGFCAALVQENSGIRIRTVVYNGNISDNELMEELNDAAKKNIRNSVVYRNGSERAVEKLYRIDIDDKKPVRTPFVRNGTYVLIGGFGGIGSLFAKRLANNYAASLYIIGRRSEAEVRSQLSEFNKDTHITYISCNITEAGQLGVVLDDISRNSSINGIISFLSAGPENYDPSNKEKFLAVSKSAEEISCELTSVKAAFADIDHFLSSREDIDLIAFTSVTGILGGQSYSTYSAASRYIYDFKLSCDKNRYYVIAWSKWKNRGLSRYDTDNDNISAEYAGYHLIKGRQGVTSAEAVLSMDIRRSVIGLDLDNQSLHRTYAVLFDTTANEMVTKICYTATEDITVKSSGNAELINRKQENVPVSDAELEKRMIDLWKKVLMISDLAPTDSFFEVGGNSLKLISLIDRINEEFGTAFTVADFYDNPSVRLITSLIKPDDAVSETNDNIIMI